MIAVGRLEFATALTLAVLAHGAVLAALAGREPPPAQTPPEVMVHLELAALGEDIDAPGPAEPAVAAAPALDASLSEPPPPDATAPVPEAPPPPELLFAEALPPEAPIELQPLPPETPPPPTQAALPDSLPPRRDPLVDLPRPRPKPPSPELARATPERALPQAPEPPAERTEVASVPAVVPPHAVAAGDALEMYGGKLYEAINAAARKHYPRQSLRRGDEGAVPVRLIVDSEGILVSIEVLDGSAASRRLVKAAVKAVERAAPFPAFASEMGAEPAAFEIRIVYTLR